MLACLSSELASRPEQWPSRAGAPKSFFSPVSLRATSSVRGRARQRGVELPLVISDHADWPELLATITDTGAAEVWVTHGREEALVHQLELLGRKGRALALVGREDENE